MGKGVIVLVLGSILIFGIMNQSVKVRLLKSTEEAADYYSSLQARNIAASTVSTCLSNLSDRNGWRVASPQQHQAMGGVSRYTVIDTPFAGQQLVKIWVESKYGGVTKYVTALTDIPALPFFKYAALAGGDFVVNGANNVFQDDANPLLNANIHTNSNMTLNVTNYNLEGFATYSGGIVANWGSVTINPNQNPANLPVHYQSPPVTIPLFNPDAYNSIATVTHAGDATYTGAIALGTVSNPKIIRVKGKLFIQGAVTGYGVFVVNSDIEVTGSVTLNPAGSTESRLGLYTGGKVLINQPGTDLHAQIFANQEVVINGEAARIYGTITTRDKVTFNAEAVKLYYRPASGALTQPFWGSVRLASSYYYE